MKPFAIGELAMLDLEKLRPWGIDVRDFREVPVVVKERDRRQMLSGVGWQYIVRSIDDAPPHHEWRDYWQGVVCSERHIRRMKPKEKREWRLGRELGFNPKRRLVWWSPMDPGSYSAEVLGRFAAEIVHQPREKRSRSARSRYNEFVIRPLEDLPEIVLETFDASNADGEFMAYAYEIEQMTGNDYDEWRLVAELGA